MCKNVKAKPLKVGIVGTGISGLSAAWLLSQNHDVTVFEKDDRIGGHTNTIDINGLGIDTGFIVYNNKVCLGEKVSFESSENEYPVSYTWNFADGTISNEANPTHIYKTRFQKISNEK